MTITHIYTFGALELHAPSGSSSSQGSLAAVPNWCFQPVIKSFLPSSYLTNIEVSRILYVNFYIYSLWFWING